MNDKNDIFKGKWIVHYDPAEHDYRDILESLIENAHEAPEKQPGCEYTEVVFDKDGVTSFPTNSLNKSFCGGPGGSFLEKRPLVAEGKNSDEPEPAGKTKIENILLYFPFLTKDKRWQTIDLTASSIFLGSALENNGFTVSVKKLQLPALNFPEETENYHLIGFTLFEEMLPEFREFLSHRGHRGGRGLRNIEHRTPNIEYRRKEGRGRSPWPNTPRFLVPRNHPSREGNVLVDLSESYRKFLLPGGKILAAGGPLVTLNPLETAYFLPDLNLLVRGEAELVLPGTLKALNRNNLQALLKYRGFIFQQPGLIIISDLNEINRPRDFNDFSFNLKFLEKKHVENGLEINFSRGCRRGCLFCSKVQGREPRKLPLEKIAGLLRQFSAAVDKSALPAAKTEFARSLNINDDDILQDINYTGKVLRLIKKYHFKLWGIQASPASFLDKNHKIRREVIEILDDKEAFVNNRVLVWLGSDAFLPGRGRRLGKALPPPRAFEELIAEFQQRDILNYHYWISSDHQSAWAEFCEEFLLICRLAEKYGAFSIIAHSPFVVPYAAAPLYRLLIKDPRHSEKIKYKSILTSSRRILTLPLVERVETGFAQLNRLLGNEKLGAGPGFFDSLKQKDYRQAAITLYNFLKQERLFYESLPHREQAELLLSSEKEIEAFIAERI